MESRERACTTHATSRDAVSRLNRMNTSFAPALRLASLALAAALASPAALAQFKAAPAAQKPKAQAASAAASDKDYKRDGARHLYAAYAKHIHKGKMPPLLYGIAIIETEIGPQGEVRDVRIVRQPAAAEVAPWAVEMIKSAGPFPAPTRLGSVRYTDIWLVDKSGRFQLDTLTEGQR
jgi:periplasmic protein TonB